MIYRTLTERHYAPGPAFRTAFPAWRSCGQCENDCGKTAADKQRFRVACQAHILQRIHLAAQFLLPSLNTAQGKRNAMKNMKAVCGSIILVQEHRFQLMDTDGIQRLFTLDHSAPQEWCDLKRLEKENCLVQVVYTESGKLQAATAHDIEQQS